MLSYILVYIALHVKISTSALVLFFTWVHLPGATSLRPREEAPLLFIVSFLLFTHNSSADYAKLELSSKYHPFFAL